MFHNCLCSHFMEFINLSAFHPLLTYFFPGRAGASACVWGSELLVLLTAQTDEQYHGRKAGGGRVRWQTCITHVSHNCRMKVNGLARPMFCPLPCYPSPHPPMATSVARATTNPLSSPPLLLATSCDARVSCCQLIFNFGARILKIFYKY